MRPTDFVTWDRVKSAGCNRFTATAYLWLFIVPLAAKVLTHLDDKLVIPVSTQKIVLELSLPFSWVVFYFASLLFTCATILYEMRCPSIVRQFNSYADFVRRKEPPERIVASYNELVLNQSDAIFLSETIGFAQRFKHEESEKRAPTGYLGNKSNPRHFPIFLDKQNLQAAFWEVFDVARKSRPLSLFATMALYSAGYGLIAVVMAQSLMFVVTEI